MPIYEYRCGSCGAERELIVKPGEELRPSCPRCRKRMRRVISPTAFILKGQGWYVTDYPSQERRKGLEAEKGTAKESAGTGAGSEAKPAGGKGAAAPPAKKVAPAKRARKGEA